MDKYFCKKCNTELEVTPVYDKNFSFVHPCTDCIRREALKLSAKGPNSQVILFPEHPPKARKVNKESGPTPKRIHIVSVYPQYDGIVRKLIFVEDNPGGSYIFDPKHTIKTIPQ